MPENFNIPVDAILGKDFIHKYTCDILNSKSKFVIANDLHIPLYYSLNTFLYIPPRSQVIRKFEIDYNNECIVDNHEIQDGIFISRTIVDPHNAYLKVLNTTENFAEISSKILHFEPLKNYNIYHIEPVSKNQKRVQLLIETLSKNSSISNNGNLLELCTQYSDIFALKSDKMSINNFYEQSLRITDNEPVFIKNYRTPHSSKTEINKQVQNLLVNDLIEPAMSNYNSPIILVPKKGNTKWRLCIDYRRLNKKLIADKFPLPRIDEILENLGKAKFFSVLDLYSGFHQIPLNIDSRDYTAFSTENGSYRWKVLPFGLNIAPNSFSRMMNIAFSGLPASQCFIYIDDIIVIGSSERHHIKNLTLVFDTCKKFNLKLNPEKCIFFKPEVIFLGHVCTQNGILPDPSKYHAIKTCPTPHDSDATRRFVAMANYYRKFLPNFANISKPLNALTRKNSIFNWSDECQKAFESIKKMLINPRILAYPDFTKNFVLTVDASKTGCGAVLSQEDKPITFASKSFSKAEQNKSTIEQELIAIHWGITHFKHYLYGYSFTVRSDHRPLVYLFNLKDPNSKLTRLRLELAEYNFVIEHIQGKNNVVADCLSRIHIKDLIETQKAIETQILVTTRSMTRNMTANANINNSLSNVDIQSNVHEDNDQFNTKKAPQLIFNQLSNTYELFLRKNKKRITKISIPIQSNQAVNAQHFLENVFAQLQSYTDSNKIKMVKILNDDVIFKQFGLNEFKNVGNKTLKSLQIIIVGKQKQIVDDEEKMKLIHLFHNNPIFGGHAGPKRLYSKLRKYYYWNSMSRDIASYTQKCQDCQTNKIKTHTRLPMCITDTPENPFIKISIDTVGPLPISINKNKYILTVLCGLSKYLIAIPMGNKEARTIAQTLVENVFLIYGLCKSILTDMGTEYINQLFTEITNMLQIDHVTATPYHPQTLGGVERSHRTLNEYLRTYLNEQNNDWDLFIRYFAYCYNTTPHTAFSFKFCPFELVFGRQPLIPELLKQNTVEPIYNFDNYAKDMKFKFQTMTKLARHLLERSKFLSKQQYDKKCNVTKFNIGDNILALSNKHKLDNVYDGPFKIINISEQNITAIDEKTNKTKNLHQNRIIRFNQ